LRVFVAGLFFSPLDECGGKVRKFDLYSYADINPADPCYDNSCNKFVEIKDINMSPKSFFNIVKKGGRKAAKELLKGDDIFKLYSTSTKQVVNGFNGDDIFDLYDSGGDLPTHRYSGGKGDDFFSLNVVGDSFTGGKGKGLYCLKVVEADNTSIITDFKKGQDKVICRSFELREQNGNAYIDIVSDRDSGSYVCMVLEDVVGLRVKEETLQLPINSSAGTYDVIY
jgi:hypothetical protein